MTLSNVSNHFLGWLVMAMSVILCSSPIEAKGHSTRVPMSPNDEYVANIMESLFPENAAKIMIEGIDDSKCEHYLELLTDDEFRPLLFTHIYQTPEDREVRDSTFLTVEGCAYRRLQATYDAQSLELLGIEENFPNDGAKWSFVLPEEFDADGPAAGSEPDVEGNWTTLYRLHRQGDRWLKDNEPMLTRRISYVLVGITHELEAQTVADLQQRRDSFSSKSIISFSKDSPKGRSTLWALGALGIMLLGAWLGCRSGHGAFSRNVTCIMAIMAPLIAAIGLYFFVKRLTPFYGAGPGIMTCLLYICWCGWTSNKILIRLQDDRSLGNSAVYTPFIVILYGILMPLGWMTGKMMWGTWWWALAWVFVFAIIAGLFMTPSFDRGQRCANCHRMVNLLDAGSKDGGTIKTVEYKNRGNERVKIESTYSAVIPLYKCPHCGHQTEGEPYKGILLDVNETTKHVNTPNRRKRPIAEPWHHCNYYFAHGGTTPCFYGTDSGKSCPYHDGFQCPDFKSNTIWKVGGD